MGTLYKRYHQQVSDNMECELLNCITCGLFMKVCGCCCICALSTLHLLFSLLQYC